MIYPGSCHCGRIAYEVEGEVQKLVECNCSHCSRKGYLLWFVDREQLRMKSADSGSTYTFNRHVIEHRFCPTCGCAPFGLAERGGKLWAAINVRCLEGLKPSDYEIQQVDGRSL